MCIPYKILSLSLLLITTALCSDVLELDDGNFDSKIREHSFGLLQFYSPRCGYCTRLAPKYEEAASILKNNNPSIVLVKVDCTVNRQTCANNEVKGYPTLRVFRMDDSKSLSFDTYHGPLEVIGMVDYMKSLIPRVTDNKSEL